MVCDWSQTLAALLHVYCNQQQDSPVKKTHRSQVVSFTLCGLPELGFNVLTEMCIEEEEETDEHSMNNEKWTFIRYMYDPNLRL